MSRNSKCCSGGGYTFGCLVIVGVYGVLISVAFTIVTALYMTVESCENIEAEIAKVVKVTHVDAFNQDNSYNGVQEPVDGVEEVAEAGVLGVTPGAAAEVVLGVPDSGLIAVGDVELLRDVLPFPRALKWTKNIN